MDLSHSFTVPTGIDRAWEHFQDIGSLAECFPGAQVTAIGEDDAGAPTFEGTCKVKLGPIALVYAGSGAFVERDETAHRFVVEAKGRDKRGNGTAGATVTVSLRADGPSTRVEVLTDLAITGKPAQFGRGVMQDVSDKLLGQFVTCLEQRLADSGDDSSKAAPEAGSDAPERPASSQAASAVSDPAPVAQPRAVADDGALDLGAAMVPVLLKSYGKQVGAAAGVLLVLVLLRRLLRR
ncbi:MAG TPA: SRPBCC family protein [Nocardioides sp.]|nr:SRPBCC family protein [Nocardioides sp.]